MRNLTELARVIRSKNSSPMKLTLDIIFKDQATYDEVRSRNLINKTVVAKAYQIEEAMVEKVTYFGPSLAVKIGLPRQIRSGSPGDTDVYGAQQHAPMLSIGLDM